MRWDMLGLLLHQTGISSKMLLVDRTKGLLTGALVLKGCPHLTVLASETENKHPTKSLIYLNLNIPKELSKYVHTQTMTQLKASSEQYSSLCIVADPEPRELIEQLADRLTSGSFITVYSNFLEPLGRAFDSMLQLRKFINIQLQDTFTREYQVLRNRTHPMMSMNGFGGYLLSAIKVDEAK